MGFVKHISKTVLAQSWGRLTQYVFDFKRRDGTRQQLTREVYERGAAVACLLYNPKTDTVLLIRQFRLPHFLVGQSGYMIEIPAGMLDGTHPVDRMRAELEEETGYRIHKLHQVYDLMMSPGGTDETVIFFTGSYDETDRVSKGGGLMSEGEDIEVLHIPFKDALSMVKSGQICDAKTVLLLQHLALEHI